MQDMSDNELDNLFKEAAEGFTPPQDASAWKQLAAMLDKNPVKPAGFWNGKTISAVTATGLLAVTSIWFAATDDQNRFPKTHEKNGANNATQGVVQEQKEQPHPTGKENFPPAQSLEDKSNGVHAVNTGEKKNSQHLSTEKSVRTNTVQPVVENQSPGSEKPEPVEMASDISALQTFPSQTEPGTSPVGLVEDKQTTAYDSLKPVIMQATAADSAENRVEIPDKKGDKPKIRGVFSIKAVVSPDFSSVNYFSAGRTGINYGMLAGYSFNNRWSVYTGVISSKKLYDTKEVEGSYSSNGHDYPVKELNGDCRILDIPINVYYTFFPERPFSLRAGLGFSSYIMRREDYVYCVNDYGNDVYYKQRVRGENNEWFKVLNVSVAVSKKLTNRFSAEVEPFVKAPLAGVGEGKVSLVSMGAFINLKYDLVIIK